MECKSTVSLLSTGLKCLVEENEKSVNYKEVFHVACPLRFHLSVFQRFLRCSIKPLMLNKPKWMYFPKCSGLAILNSLKLFRLLLLRTPYRQVFSTYFTHYIGKKKSLFHYVYFKAPNEQLHLKPMRHAQVSLEYLSFLIPPTLLLFSLLPT